MKGRCLIVAVASLLLSAVTPQLAGAASVSDYMAYLQGLSGPGPFDGGLLSTELWCIPAKERGQPPFCTRGRAKVRIVLEAGWWDDRPKPDFQGNVYLRTYQVIGYVPLSNIVRSDRAWLSPFELGAGVGLYRFSGAGVGESAGWYGSVPLRFRVTPIEFASEQWRKAHPRLYRVLRAGQFRAGVDYLPGEFSQDDFQGAPASYREDSHWLGTYGPVLDLTMVVDALRSLR